MQGNWAIGLMSGTSGDGVDAALIRADAERIYGFGPDISVPYDPAFRTRLKATYGGRGPAAEISVVEQELTVRHAEAVMNNLGVTSLFDGIFDIVHADYIPKPTRAPSDAARTPAHP